MSDEREPRPGPRERWGLLSRHSRSGPAGRQVAVTSRDEQPHAETWPDTEGGPETDSSRGGPETDSSPGAEAGASNRALVFAADSAAAAGATPEVLVEPQTAGETPTVAETAAEAPAEPQPQATQQPEPEPQAEAPAEPQPQATQQPEPEPQAEAPAEPQPQATQQPEPEPQAEAPAEPRPEPTETPEPSPLPGAADSAAPQLDEVSAEVPAPTLLELPHGRVATDGTVYLTRGGSEVVIGSMPGDPAEAAAFFTRRYEDLEVQVALLEQRMQSGAASSEDAASTLGRLRTALASPAALGDIDGLVRRLDALDEAVQRRRAAKRAARAKALEQAKERKEAIVAEAEALSESNDWRAGAERLRTLLDEWKALPRLDRASDDALWHRFSSARTHYTRRRKAHFAELAERREASRATKQALVERAVALSTTTDWAAGAAGYRDLMSQWKAAGPAPKELEESLWSQFRAAQDTFFAARSAASAARESTYSAALAAKQTLLSEAEALLPVEDWKVARARLRDIQDRWEAAGRVPRDQMASIDARLRRVEDAIRDAESSQWKRSNPEGRARAEDTVAKLQASIRSLEAAQEAALSAGNRAAARDAETGLATKRAWLAQAEQTLAEFGGSPKN